LWDEPKVGPPTLLRRSEARFGFAKARARERKRRKTRVNVRMVARPKDDRPGEYLGTLPVGLFDLGPHLFRVPGFGVQCSLSARQDTTLLALADEVID
jgi:hypothetical protein